MGKKNRRHGGGGSSHGGGSAPKSGKQHHRRSGSSSNGNGVHYGRGGGSDDDEDPYSLYSWLKHEKEAPHYIVAFVVVGFLIGLGMGTGHLTGDVSRTTAFRMPAEPTPWRLALGRSIRSSSAYSLVYGSSDNRRSASYLQSEEESDLDSLVGPDIVDTNIDRQTSGSTSIGSSPPSMQPTGSATTTTTTTTTTSTAPSAAPKRTSSAGGGSSIGSSPPSSSYGSGRGGFLSSIFSSTPKHAHDSSRAFAVLREMIVREEGGFVHPDLGFLTPAPCGADRGIGMVRDSYDRCQLRCTPGNFDDYVEYEKEVDRVEQYWLHEATDEQIKNRYHEEMEFAHYERNPRENWADPEVPELLQRMLEWDEMTPAQREENLAQYPDWMCGPRIYGSDVQKDLVPRYNQTEVLIKVPYSIQMTKEVALEILGPRMPPSVARNSPLEELDDGIILALLLSHERGLGKDSLWYPYIATLPPEPLCGYWPLYRATAFDTITTLGLDIGMDVSGWASELVKASNYADSIADSLAKEYGTHLFTIQGKTAYESIRWALCHVFSRAIAGNGERGALRLIPMLDILNHYLDADPSKELKGTEAYKSNDRYDADEEDAGAFVVRSFWHGNHKPLRKGHELLINYNVPQYSPLDWFINLGFVPLERMKRWEKIEPVFPRKRRDPRRKADDFFEDRYRQQEQELQLQPQLNRQQQSQSGPATSHSTSTSNQQQQSVGSQEGRTVGSSASSDAKRIITNIASSSPGGAPGKPIIVTTDIAAESDEKKEEITRQIENLQGVLKAVEEEGGRGANTDAGLVIEHLKKGIASLQLSQKLRREKEPLELAHIQLQEQIQLLPKSHSEYDTLHKQMEEQLAAHWGQIQHLDRRLAQLEKESAVYNAYVAKGQTNTKNSNDISQPGYTVVNDALTAIQAIAAGTSTSITAMDANVNDGKTALQASVELKPDGTLEIIEKNGGTVVKGEDLSPVIGSLIQKVKNEMMAGKTITGIKVNGEWQNKQYAAFL
mmetsp:Transcript_34119/g.75049  ORF Transcript_34119/g.75049 Transcript_34119/m.75049 type:complete len:1005 (+) Transcript_34119:246-3260(+)